MSDILKETVWGTAVDKLNHLKEVADIVRIGGDDVELNNTTWTKLTGTFTNPTNNGMAVDGNKITCLHSGLHQIIGVSDVAITEHSGGVIYYSLHINGVESGRITTHTFTSKNKYENIAIVGFVTLGTNDHIEIFAKSGEVSETISITSLIVTVQGV